MLIGEYIHTIDEKSRVSMPYKFRGELGKKIVLTPGLEKCLFVFTAAQWKNVAEKLGSSEAGLSFLKADQRNFGRYLFGRATEAEIDSAGRILIPDFLKKSIGLGSRAAIVGLRDRVEIWEEKAWISNKEVVEKKAAELSEKLGDDKRTPVSSFK